MRRKCGQRQRASSRGQRASGKMSVSSMPPCSVLTRACLSRSRLTSLSCRSMYHSPNDKSRVQGLPGRVLFFRHRGLRRAATGACTATGRPARDCDCAAASCGRPTPPPMRPPSAPATLIRNATVLTGTGERIDDGDVLIADGQIAAVGTRPRRRRRTRRVVDAAGKWVTPGLIDVHSHLGVYPEPGRGCARRRQRVDRSGDAERLGRAFRVAAGPGLRGGAAGRRHLAADPARLREPDRRARRDAEERAGDDLPGDEIPRRAAGPEDGLRREPEARLRRRRPVPVHAHGQRRRLPPGLRGCAGLHGAAGTSTTPSSRSTRRTGEDDDEDATPPAAAEARPQARDARRRDAGRHPRAHPLLSRRRDGDDARPRARSSASRSPPSTTASRPTSSPTASPTRASAARCGPTGGASRWKPTTASRRTSRWSIARRAAAPSCTPIPRKASSASTRKRRRRWRAASAPASTSRPSARSAGSPRIRRRRSASLDQTGTLEAGKMADVVSGTARRSASTRSPSRCSSTACCVTTARIPRPSRDRISLL